MMPVIGVFVWLLGLCVGSFLNVVVYRLPAGLSIRRPARSFCPKCGEGIAWYDNIPLLSWLWLRARCRHCGAAISVQYPLVEAATGMAFVLVYYLLFGVQARAGVGPVVLTADWPLLLGWLVLLAALVACAAMDLVSYMVDVRVTYVAMAAGLACHAVWPNEGRFGPAAPATWSAAAVTCLLASGVLMWFTVWRCPEEDMAEEDTLPADDPSPSEVRALRVGGVLGLAACVGLTLWLIVSNGSQAAGYPFRNPAVPGALVVLFALMVLAGGQPRAVDEEVTEALEEEQPEARRLVLRELAWLTGPILAGGLAWLVVTRVTGLGEGWTRLLEWTVGPGCRPLGGAVYAAFGLIVGAGAGWLLRIVFTLVFGREALGTGDIYILAAAGAAGGWDIALAGLGLAVGFAIAGFLCSLALKRTLVIPFGPWLALGFVAALWLNRPLVALARRYVEDMTALWTRRPDLCFVAAGVMLIGTAVSIVVARLVRRAVEAGGN